LWEIAGSTTETDAISVNAKMLSCILLHFANRCESQLREHYSYRKVPYGDDRIGSSSGEVALPKTGGARPQTQNPAALALQAKFEKGVALHQQGKLADAERFYVEVLRQQPKHFDALHLLGVIALQTQRTERGVELIRKAIGLNAKVAAAHSNLGTALRDLKRPADALVSHDRAIALKPDFAEAYSNRGIALLDLKRPADALVSHDKAIALKPDYAEAYNNRGTVLRDLKRPADALVSYDKAIALKPDYAEAYSNRGTVLRDLKRPADALVSYDKAIALQPDYAEAYSNRGNALLDLKRPADALVSYDKAIALKPDYAEAYSNRGTALSDLKRPADALVSYDKAIALKPDYAEAYLNQGLCLLLTGRFEQGLRQYEWRKKRDEPLGVRPYPQPVWLGENNIAGKTLFIYWEQGLGDTIQFCRYAKLVEARGTKVIMSVQQPLLGLLKQISPTIQIINQNEEPTHFDYHCSLLSLPLAFGTTLETIPAKHEYLKADEELRSLWSARLPPKTKPRIGVVWSGRIAHHNDHNRSIELQQFLAIFSTGADWICLQNEIRKKDLAVLQQNNCIALFGNDLRDFSDTAALVDLMDLVITVDTSVAHLAGAMGKPVWILLPHNPDWRWLLDRNDSPWYPSARLFRQQQIGSWAGVIDLVNNKLQSVIL
jgi:tetratricopeptide (TPR) repeat protein